MAEEAAIHGGQPADSFLRSGVETADDPVAASACSGCPARFSLGHGGDHLSDDTSSSLSCSSLDGNDADDLDGGSAAGSDEEARATDGEADARNEDRSQTNWLNGDDVDDIPLHSLEEDKYGPSIQRVMSQYLDHGLEDHLLARGNKKGREKEAASRTIKAAAQQLSSQKLHVKQSLQKLYILRDYSNSMTNLTMVSSAETTPSPTSVPASPTFMTSVQFALQRDNQLQLTEKGGENLDISKKLKMRRRKRMYDVSRTHERDLKMDSAGPDLPRCCARDSRTSQQGKSGCSVFHCLPSASGASHACSSPLRSPSIHTTEYHPERLQFYRTLIHFIRERKKEAKPDKIFERLESTEDPSYRQDIKDILWLELMSWHAGTTMKEQDELLCSKRQNIPIVIAKIMNFSVGKVSGQLKDQSSPVRSDTRITSQQRRHSDLGESIKQFRRLSVDSEQKQGRDEKVPDLRIILDNDKKAISRRASLVVTNDSLLTQSAIHHSRNSSENLVTEEDDNCGCSETLSKLCENCISRETEALEKVKHVLDELDVVEHLYPCTKLLGSDYSDYTQEKFETRVRTLNLWYNVTTDLRQRIDLLAKMLGIQERSRFGWPCYSCNDAEDCKPTVTSPPTPTRDNTLYKSKSRTVQFHNVPPSSSSTSSTCSEPGDSASVSIPTSPEASTSSPCLENLYRRVRRSSRSTPASSAYDTSIYHHYVDKTLRRKGLRHIYSQLSRVLRPLLYRVHAALKRPKPASYAEAAAKVVHDHHLPMKRSSDGFLSYNKEHSEELAKYGVWSEAFQEMELPTFHRPFLFLLRVPLDVVHECLRVRLEQSPEEPSSLSIGQLIKECKEVLRAGVQMRQRYVNLAQTVLGEGGSDAVEAQLDAFDEDLKSMLELYLRYLDQKMRKVAQVIIRQKSFLEEEWAFVRATCPSIPGGEALAAKSFCYMASYLLTTTGDHLETKIDEYIEQFTEDTRLEEDSSSVRKAILQACRKFKSDFQEASESSRQAIAFAKTLRKDLEIATQFKILVPAEDLLEKLRETDHIRVVAPHCCNHIMFVPGYLHQNEAYIWQLVDMTCGHENTDFPYDQEGYLIMMHYDAYTKEGLVWKGPTIVLEPTAEATITLSHVEVDGVLLVVNHSSQLMSQCRRFQRLMGSTLQVNKQQTSCNDAIAEALNDLKVEALQLREKITNCINSVEACLEDVTAAKADETDRLSLQNHCREVLHQGYKFGFEYQKGVTRLITGEARIQLGKGLVQFALMWVKFVLEKCERGRGQKPSWASQGLEFLITACDLQYLQILTDDEFKELKEIMNEALTHLVGTSEKSPSVASKNASPYFGRSSGPQFQRSHSATLLRTESNSSPSPVDDVVRKRSKDSMMFDSGYSSSSASSSIVSSLIDGHSPENHLEKSKPLLAISPMERVLKATQALEERQQRLLLSKNTIGRVSDIVIHQAPFHINARKVAFPWQRGFKIGEGRSGKVYTAVNNHTGELIAMKEIRLQPNDHRVMKEVYDEIRILEGIKHPNLIHYYGVEIHREEMLIFMEYCNAGTLENAAILQLPESLVRKYTRQLLEAVSELHDHGIVHRDIKSANIFLTTDGNLKLGDFGCCIKLKNHTTMPGELQAFVGTPAYMAPEIFTKNIQEGHGRAADIWSVGCVVLEMATAKRPWHDLDNSYQIMFQVGMGRTPEIPESLSSEGQDFLTHCLQHNPEERWTAGKLLVHPFTKVNEEDS